MKLINLKIITPKGVYFDKEVEIVTVRTINGDLGLLYGHIPMVSSIVPSTMSYRIEGVKKILHISGGILQAEKTFVKIITDKIETEEERQKRFDL